MSEAKVFTMRNLTTEEIREKAQEYNDTVLQVAADMGIRVIWFDGPEKESEPAGKNQ